MADSEVGDAPAPQVVEAQRQQGAPAEPREATAADEPQAMDAQPDDSNDAHEQAQQSQADGPAPPQANEQEPQSEAQQQQQREQQEAPASSPLPARPTPAAVTPGPRATRLGETYAHALRRTLSKLSAWENFAGCYPTVAARAEGVLRQVQEQMVEKLGEKCEKEFENILVARSVVPKFNELEALIADAAERRAEASPSDPEPTPPHLLPPSDVLAAHLALHLAPHQSTLNARLQTTQAQNALLAERVACQRAEIDALVDRLDAAAADVRGANEAIGSLADELAAESRAAGVDGVP